MLNIGDPANLQLLRWVFTDPDKLRPLKSNAAITTEAAAQFAKLAKALRSPTLPDNDPPTPQPVQRQTGLADQRASSPGQNRRPRLWLELLLSRHARRGDIATVVTAQSGPPMQIEPRVTKMQ